MSWLTTATALLQLLPAIITAIRAIEEAIPGKGQGEAKLAAIREILESVSGQVSSLWPFIEKAISVLVGLFNKTGTFTKG
jgi:hypothetical protein